MFDYDMSYRADHEADKEQESLMLLWECTYKVNMHGSMKLVKDWVWSTSQPVGNTIGHYWRHLFNYPISEERSYLAAPGVDCARAIIRDA